MRVFVFIVLCTSFAVATLLACASTAPGGIRPDAEADAPMMTIDAGRCPVDYITSTCKSGTTCWVDCFRCSTTQPSYEQRLPPVGFTCANEQWSSTTAVVCLYGRFSDPLCMNKFDAN